jgi:heterodisulfide reductase subunit A
MLNEKSILVIGAGITGATVAQHLSQAGMSVHLIEKDASIGGHVAEMGCKATDICLRCNVCRANELLRNVANSDDIHIHTKTELMALDDGASRRYRVKLKHVPTYIVRDKCLGCQACVQACPEKCIIRPKIAGSIAVPIIDYSLCRRSYGKECSVCEQTCPADAINMRQQESESQIEIDNVVIATGYEPYNPAENASYGYGGAENIITGIEAERQLAIQHKITRPSDGLQPKRIAFIQCVGSRSEEIHRRPEDTDYCSAVCCAYALRMARMIKHQNKDVEITIFYMDIQNFGKGFNDFYNECKDNMNFIRSRPYEVKRGRDGTVCITFSPQSLPSEVSSQICEQEFDLVVLAVGIRPNAGTVELAEKLLVTVDEYGFFGFKSVSPLPVLQREGIFVAGACESPKDIQSCMAQAEAVSTAVISSG